MKTKTILLSLLGLLILPVSAFAALATPIVTAVPATINANTYTLTIKVPIGSKVTVVGGPSDLAPVTDGAGKDKLDGVVKVMVGLAQEQKNVFSITAEKGGQFSSSVTVTINETSKTTTVKKGDVTPPAAPELDPIENPVSGTEYEITGSCEAEANIYADSSDGTRAGSSHANSNGIFSVSVKLEAGKTNRINVYAEDAAGNIGPSAQAVIQSDAPVQSQDNTVAEDSAKPTPFTDISGHWAEIYIDQIYEKGIANGKTENSFDPNANITRAELTKIALNASSQTVKT